ncbi:MAG: Tex family protein [Synoicihabitans sp.]
MPSDLNQPNPEHIVLLSEELSISVAQIAATAQLLLEGATVPFIARYRKEVTGSLDEVAVTAIRDRLESMRAVDDRRRSLLKSLAERGLLTDALKKALADAVSLTQLEDIYLPFRPKKRTRATIAKELGLEPLADQLWQQSADFDPVEAAKTFVGNSVTHETKTNTLETIDDVLAGARDILAERISDDAAARTKVRHLYRTQSTVSSKVMFGKEEAGAKFKDYFDWSESLATAPSHRILAMRRGEKEGILMMRVQLDDEALAFAEVQRLYVTNDSPAAQHVRLASEDASKRLIFPSMETEMRLDSKKRADADGIKVFAENLRELLLASPLGQKAVMAIDPGFRTGCKVVLLDKQGKLLHNDVIFPDRHGVEAEEKLRGFVDFFKVEAIAIGNGTAGRETEAFVRGLKLSPAISVVLVNESGASIYSASEVAREEFPDQDLTVRGAVSIGRRLMDPLAELVKLDPKSIGVGQYQHDVDQNELRKSLDDTVVSSVNGVGVELNTASKQLLAYVSGLNASTAAAIIERRNSIGPFKSRAELRDVPRLGPKAFEQAAGFLRIRDAEHPLDASAVHPERYALVEKMAGDLGVTVGDLISDSKLRARINLDDYVCEEVGLPTLQDIIKELAKPGRDPREKFEAFAFAPGINQPSDLKPGMKIPGLVTNVTAFGAFVDVGVHQDGLVHVSQIADTFVKDPSEHVKPGQKVVVTVTELDLARNRIALSMRANPEIGGNSPREGKTGNRNSPGQARRGNHTSSRPPRRDSNQSLGGDWFSAALNKRK